MTLFVVDVSRHQVERTDPLDLATAKAAGFGAVNIQLDRGRQDDVLPSWARTYADRARELGLGISTYRWLDSRISGAESARRAYDRILALGGPAGMAHVVDCEDDAPEQTLRDYVTTMTGLLGRPIAIYSGRWWLQPRGWRVSDLSPHLWAAPSAGYLNSYPGDSSPQWTVNYGGYTTLGAMQYAVSPLPGTGPCSLSAIRDPAVWTALTGGPMAWYLNPALTNYRNAVNAKYPRRDKGSDGTIGDTAHAGTNSDHNPDPDGSVDAWDMDVELNGVGKPYQPDVEALKAVFQAHESSQYWIHDDIICSRNDGWARRSYAYAGPSRNRHDKHVHWNTRQSHENSNASWVLGGSPQPQEEDMPLVFFAKLAGVDTVHLVDSFMTNRFVTGDGFPVLKAALTANGLGTTVWEWPNDAAHRELLGVNLDKVDDDPAPMLATLTPDQLDALGLRIREGVPTLDQIRGVVDDELDEQSRAGADTDA